MDVKLQFGQAKGKADGNRGRQQMACMQAVLQLARCSG